MAHPLSVIRYPSGRFGFVGRVPTDLAFIFDSEDDVKTAVQCGAGFARKAAERAGRRFPTRTWDTEDAARADAKAAGYSVTR